MEKSKCASKSCLPNFRGRLLMQSGLETARQFFTPCVFMKYIFFKIGLRLAVFQLGLLLCQNLRGGAARVHDYAGRRQQYLHRQHHAPGQRRSPSGHTVVIQKFLDANTDGVIDAGDILVQQFNLTDSQPGMHRRRDEHRCARRHRRRRTAPSRRMLLFQFATSRRKSPGIMGSCFPVRSEILRRSQIFHRHQFPFTQTIHRHRGQQRHKRRHSLRRILFCFQPPAGTRSGIAGGRRGGE